MLGCCPGPALLCARSPEAIPTRRTGHPAASAGGTLRVIMEKGKFQGVMAPTTPTGCRMTR